MTITVNGLSKVYGRRTVVDQISFTLQRGQTLGLLGPNGAGKSTTMRMLMGLTRPSSGSALIMDYDLLTQVKQIQSRIGVVFEKPNLFENLTGYQNLAFFCKLHHRPVSPIRPLLERMELWDRAHEPVKIYSKGMRQRILILRALVHQPQVLFLDEPCSGLDPVSTRIIRDYLLELKAQGITMLLTSHDMEEVDELCDLIGFINHGRLIVLEQKQSLKAAYGSQHLKVTYQTDAAIREELLDPINDLAKLEQLYRENRVIAVRSTEASLADIFRKLSGVN
ncbi:MAG TPA: ABC transporter ATP-binding protein [Bacillota bacterium]|nr:ABC transporter ATP-binding protein [Bacillota bacterium]